MQMKETEKVEVKRFKFFICELWVATVVCEVVEKSGYVDC